ncbi:bifunctional histidinol-phosphatase/imidazoleglycerol-phosphate dehydratase HisB [Odoribacter sp. AF15-53]|uniref:bifunctional histidinol-phosphatase/imidazoleglycerol-phosphate dehydratase HisB n=1 Tax=Odoribacter sp. AF15-53 TaxID=2292236 RepID=UPI000E4DFC3F|nr:bifunctional histidinol-phosphatase/imidazoleglycerol-phosphate dehydratase HisB [Odoribacter sp. AF15-53]RHR78965.1 bifunctional histidinol-phosphatase/imidazoleglycerol-phosphate dehydratase HisB [Odoribacter sp. AF15-53]
MKKILFIDRDGTIIQEPPGDYQVDSMEKLAFVPGVIGALREIVRDTDYRLVMVSNQDGLGTGRFPMDTFLPPHEFMLKTLAGEEVVFDEVLIDESMPEDCSPRRKPGTGMVGKYLNESLDRMNSYVIGDRLTDMQLAENMGIRGIFFGEEEGEGLPIVLSTGSWGKIVSFLKQGSRQAIRVRTTAETAVRVALDLNGTGQGEVKTGIAFFDHMLEQVVRHGEVDLVISVKGDLQVDEHHTIEDTAIVLGECFAEALGGKKGIGRYGFALPMDEAKAEVLLDFGGRSWLEWNATFSREYVGDFPTEMTKHFFASFCQGARCNLHVTAKGENTHHTIEAIFKAFARCLKMAVRQETGGRVPSTKGVI